MNHYDVLGVERSASERDIRKAYLALARIHHPDHHVSSRPEVRRAAEGKMRLVNEAWHQLGDQHRRLRYDGSLDSSGNEPVVEPEPDFVWRPYDEAPDIVDERLRVRGRRQPAGIRILSMAPPALLVFGLFTLVLGVLIHLRPVVALGFVALVLAGLLFVVAPLAVIMESRRHDQL